MNILIVKLGSLGDIVHTLPALAALRRRFPDSRIDWLVESRCREILADCSGVDEVLEVDTLGWRKRPHSTATWREVRRSLRRLRSRRYDVVFDFQGLVKSGVFARLARSERRVGFARTHLRESLSAAFTHERLSPPESVTHVIDRYLYLLRAVGIDSAERVFGIGVAEEFERQAERTLDSLDLSDYVAMSPGGGWQTKRWSPRRYGKLAGEIKKSWGLPSLVIWGPGEKVLAEQVVEASEGAARLLPEVGIRQLIPFLKRARLFVGGDTGPSHIACALGVTVVGLFGPSDPAKNGPVGAEDHVVWKAVPCSPCYKRRCPGYGTICLCSVAVPEVLEAVRLTLNGSSYRSAP